MHLKEIIENLDFELIYGDVDKDIKGVSCDSRKCKRDFIFVAITGYESDGHKFIKNAIENGATVIFYEANRGIDLREFYGKEITFVKVLDTRKVFSKLCTIYYKFPSKELNIIGITGTNGKTTITYILEKILKNCGVIGTVNYRFKDIELDADNTTPDPCEINKILRLFRKNGAENVVMEVSSHAMEMNRVENIDFNFGIFTNLTSEHLDFHKNMENYFLAKSRFFTEILDNNSVAIINIDDEYGKKLIDKIKYKKYSYSLSNREADVYVEKYRTSLKGSEISIKLFNDGISIKTNLIGKHNIYNILASVTAAYLKGYPVDKIEKSLQAEIVIPGRLEKVVKNKNIFVDYAHTEDALKNVLTCLKELKKKNSKLITVFGCGGDRDKLKRPKMGEVAAELSDFIVITSDNPRTEDPLKIIDDIVEGVKGKIDENNYRIIPERKDAIEMSLRLAKNGDIVLVAGKGHENYQIIGKTKIDFDDREVILNFLKKRGNV